MGLGGPVWHASAAPLPGALVGETVCRRVALAALDGVGDAALGEWREWTGRAYHVRRRLSAAEQQRVGPALDVRGTEEARHRAARLGPRLHLAPAEVLSEELGSHQ